MQKSWLWAIIPSLILMAVIVFFVVLLLVKWLWAWTIPDLFPGAVAQGLVAGDIGWFTAFKMALFIAVLSGVAGLRHHDHYQG